MPAKRKGNRKNRKIKFSEINYVENLPDGILSAFSYLGSLHIW